MNTARDISSWRLLGIAAVAAFLIIAASSMRRVGAVGTTDFPAFYCGGAAIAIGADPYRIEPLRACEHNGGNIRAHPLESGSVLPVPLPGYDLAPFALLARLPYKAAELIWELLLWASVAATIFATWKLAQAHPSIIIAALLFSDGYISSLTGQIAPLAIAAITLAAWCATRGWYARATLSAALALCEPHVGAGAFAALMFFVPASRAPGALCILTLGAFTYTATGIVWTSEYFRDVLPRHILAEVHHQGQYSLTSLLHLAGASDARAAVLGEFSYLVALALGLFVAGRLRASLRNDAFLVLIPTMFTVIGGPFIHLTQIAAAIPAAFALYRYLPEQRRFVGWAIMLLATPWGAFNTLQSVQLTVFLSIALLTWHFISDRRIAAAVTFAQLTILMVAAASFHFDKPILHIDLPPTALSEDAWKINVETVFSGYALAFLPFKVPTWCGLLIIAWAALRAAQRNTPLMPSRSSNSVPLPAAGRATYLGGDARDFPSVGNPYCTTFHSRHPGSAESSSPRRGTSPAQPLIGNLLDQAIQQYLGPIA